jgi:mono/diheme cytochrome c family protein
MSLAAAALGARLLASGHPGKSTFISYCGACHVLMAAGTVGTVGPNLDSVRPRLAKATIIKAVKDGGASVMTAVQVAKFSTQMTPYKGVLTTKQIDHVANFVYVSTHPS